MPKAKTTTKSRRPAVSRRDVEPDLTTDGRSVVSFARLQPVMPLPNLLEVQRRSFQALLQPEGENGERRDISLERVFKEIFPITDVNENYSLEFVSYSLGEPKYSVEECMERDMTYAAPLKARLRLVINEEVDGEKRPRDILEKEVYLGELPLLTEMGTFVINGAERVIVSQLHRSPGVVFEETIHPNATRLYSARIIPFRGSWVEFTLDIHDVIHVHIDKRKKFPATALLRALGYGSDPSILDLFYGVRKVELREKAVTERGPRREIVGALLARAVKSPDAKEKPETIRLPQWEPESSAVWLAEDVQDKRTGRLLGGVGDRLTADLVRRLRHAGVKELDVYRNEEVFLARRGDELVPELLKRLRRAEVRTIYVYSSAARIPLRGRYEDLTLRRDWSPNPQLAADVVEPKTGEVLAERWDAFTPRLFQTLKEAGVAEVLVFTGGPRGESPLIKNTLTKDPTKSEGEAIYAIYALLRPGEPPNLETARAAIERLFFSPKRYDLGLVGRYKLNQRLKDMYRLVGMPMPPREETCLTPQDLIAILRYLIELHEGRGYTDDIDHLGNRRVRTVGELIANQFSVGLSRMARLVRERMSILADPEKMNIDDLVNARTVSAVIQAFFGSSQLSQFMDQTNSLAELTHKRRLSALGPGGLTRERAGFEVRDVHYSHYGRMCPIETPEGPNIGLITSLTTYGRINDLGFIETPYRRVANGRVTDEIVWLTATEEEEYAVAQANARLNPDGTFRDALVLCRLRDDYPLLPPEQIDFMDVAPDQMVAISPALIPFLEHDDANRALMGSNMQRQAVPLLFPERPLVATGLEGRVAHDGGSVVVARRRGSVVRVTADEVVIDTGAVKLGGDRPLARLAQYDRYKLKKFWRTNQDTAINQRPLVRVGDRVRAGQAIADGASTDRGELALGRNVLVALMPWYGFNFEDAIVISERLQKEDVYTSIHIQELELHVRDTKRGMEEITREIPNVSEEALVQLDERGIVRIGARVKPGDILVGKITPKGETELSPEEKLLTAIFGEKAKDVKDSSLRVPPGMEGTVIDVKIFSRRPEDPLLEKEHGQKIGEIRQVEREEIRRIGEARDEELRELMRGQTIQLCLKKGSIEPLVKEGKKVTDALLEELDFNKIDLNSLKVKSDDVNAKIRRVVDEAKRRTQKVKERTEEQIDKVFQPDELSPGVVQLVKVDIAQKRKIAVGDKIAGRHGNKGVIARIVPEEDMPFLPDGTPVDVVLNPLGVPSRMNVGQILEAHLGWAARIVGFEARTPVFQGASEDEIGLLLKLASIRWAHDVLRVKRVRCPEFTVEDVRELVRAVRAREAEAVRGNGARFRPSGSPEGIGCTLDSLLDEAMPRRIREKGEEYAKYLVAACTELAERRGAGRLDKAGFPNVAALARKAKVREGVDLAVAEFLRAAGLTPAGKARLRDGRTGEEFGRPVTVGWIYMMKLAHLVDDKIHARSIGPYSLVTQQPLAGKAQFGGQRFGEMEVWALEAYGAAHTLQEMLTVKSDDVTGRSRVYEAVVKGENLPDPGIPESFNVLVKELQALGLSVELGQRESDPVIDFPRHRDSRPQEFDSIKLKIASPEEIRAWSYGEVTKPETINYRSFKPERDGLFCERIFGPVKDWECHCGKFKRIRYRGHVCDKCGVEVTLSKVRRERMGHIELAVPVAHIWFFKTLPSQMGYLLGMTLRDLEKVIYYANYVVTNPGKQDVRPKQLLEEEEYVTLRQAAKSQGDDEFKAEIGAEGIRTLLRQIDIDRLAKELRQKAAEETSQHRKKQYLKRLKVVESFRNSDADPVKRNRPEWMVMDVIPVIPPDLRPLVPLDGGRFATSDLNDLYRRVINRNNRLKKLMEMRAPEVILRNEKRMLQEAVDALFDNGRRGKAIRGRGKRPLKSLSDMLKGKQGRFRQNLLGKRVDYSGRSVIVVGPELKLHQCGLPKIMAVELFKPFIIHELERRGEAETVKRAKKIVERDDPKVYEVLEDIIKDHPVLLNRAPTLHRLGIQAFEPVLVEGKAIRIHPLVCAAFNADFDGDQMAVHVPLSFEAQLEARVLMLSSNNVLLPSNGRPVATATQDMVLGCYLLTALPRDFEQRLRGAPRVASAADVELALANGQFQRPDGTPDYQRPIWYLFRGEWVGTTVGRVLFNDIIPGELRFRNETMDKNSLSDLVFECYRKAGLRRTTELLDHLKEFGFRYATQGGVSIGIEDLEIPAEKERIIAQARGEVERFTRAYQKGVISNGERYNKVIDAWTHANNDVTDAMVEALARSEDGLNPVYMMMTSGARGSRDQVRQLAGMRGLMAKPQKRLTGGIGEIIESPILSNFREGLTVLEYFISTHGARKGLADTALKTADAGYLTRRLVDVAQDVTIMEEDCGTVLGVDMSALKEGEDIIEPLRDRIVGNVALEDVYDPIEKGKKLVEAGQVIEEEAAEAIEEAGIQSVKIRSVLTCEARRGICRKCYGRNLATMQLVDLGEAVGILAAQSIGEPGTQLTLRTFHIGGTAARIAAQTQRKSKIDGRVRFERLTWVPYGDGQKVVTSREGEILMLTPEGHVRSRLAVPYGATLHVDDGQAVKASQLLFSWDPYSEPIVADVDGVAEFIEILEEETVREELDEITGRRQLTIIEDRDKKLHPRILIKKDGKRLREFIVPVGAQLVVRDNQKVSAGETLAKISREVYKTRDITGGLPRVAELFEARRPKDPAVVSEVDGVVRFGEIKRGKRQIVITLDSGEEHIYEVPVGKHLRVHEGDRVRAGDRLSEGAVNPHDILRIKGPRAVQEYLLNEIQEIYRLQGVKINDKHIGVIVRQMLQKVRIMDPGDTEFLEGEHVDRVEFLDVNKRVQEKGGKPARAEPLLLGITKASLTTRSFISAASFQETTRVLTDAAVRGALDRLEGLKENIIIGHLVPAGTGVHRHFDVEFLVEGAPMERELEALAAERVRPAEAEPTEELSLAELIGGKRRASQARPEERGSRGFGVRGESGEWS